MLDYDLWRAMTRLQTKIKFKLIWDKVDSHIHTRTLKKGVLPNGDEYSIRLNEQADEWAGDIREEYTQYDDWCSPTQFFFKDSVVTIQHRGCEIIYGNIAHLLRENISEYKLLQHLMNKNPH